MTISPTFAGQVFRAETVVLQGRPLRPDADQRALSRFGDDMWDLTPGVFEDHSSKLTMSFGSFPSEWQYGVRAYTWLLINDDAPQLNRGPQRRRISLTTITQMRSKLRRFLQWCTAHQIRSLGDLTPALYDDFLVDLITDPSTGVETKKDVLIEVRRLWSYRDLLPSQMRLPPAPPWANELIHDLLGRPRRGPENARPRISDETLLPLMAWAFRFVEDLAADIHTARLEYLAGLRLEYRHQQETVQPNRRRRTEPLVHLSEVLAYLRERGQGIPGRTTESGKREINWNHLNRLRGTRAPYRARGDLDLIVASGLELDDDAYLTTRCDASIDGSSIQWGPYLAWRDVMPLVTHLHAACFVTIAYLSGMRPGEILDLRAGCLTTNPTTGLNEVRGRGWKSAVRSDRTKIEEGAARQLPWIVDPVAAKAIQVLERIHPEGPLFPKAIRPVPIRGNRPIRNGRPGTARTSSQMRDDILNFVNWVNQHCERYQRGDSIPPDPHGSINPSRFRRTLAWHIVRRPRGLLAASIQYGHLSTLVTQGYAGSRASGFPSEMAFEEWLHRVEHAAEMGDYLLDGGTVSGPGAEALIKRTHQANSKFVGKVLPTTRQAEGLLKDPTLQIYPGEGMHCVYNASTALCSKEGTTPVLGECHSSCTNIARTDDDIANLQATVERLTQDTLAPSVRRQRVEAIAIQAATVVAAHREATQ